MRHLLSTMAVGALATGSITHAAITAVVSEGVALPGGTDLVTVISNGVSTSQTLDQPFYSRSTGALSFSLTTASTTAPRVIFGRTGSTSAYGPLLSASGTNPFAVQTGVTTGGVLTYSEQFAASTDQRTYRGTAQIAARGDVAPGGTTTSYYGFQSNGSKSNDGSIAVFYSATTATANGTTSTGSGLFQNGGTTTTRIIGDGDTVSGAAGGGTLTLTGTGAVSSNFRVAGTATTVNYITGVVATGTNNTALVRNGVVLTAGGLPIQQGQAVGGGSVGETWSAINNDIWNISNSGSWIHAGDTNADSAVNDLLTVNGTIVAREGSTVDGKTIGNFGRGIGVNDSGDYAYVTSTGTGATLAVYLYVDNVLLASLNDSVTLADGSTSLLTNIGSQGGLAISERDADNHVTVYFFGQTTNSVDSLFSLTTTVPEPTLLSAGFVLAGFLGRRRRA